MNIKKISLTQQIIIATILAIIAGIVFKDSMANIKFLGEIFLRLLQMPVIIFVFCSVVLAVGSLKPSDLGKIGIKSIILFMITTVIAGLIGVIVVNIFQPGRGIILEGEIAYNSEIIGYDFQTLIVEFFPKNIVASMASGNMIHIIVFAILFGLALSILHEKDEAQRIISLLNNVGDVILKIIQMIIRFAPIGIFALLSNIVGSIGVQVLVSLFKYLIAIAIGTLIVLSIHTLVVALYGKVNPSRIVKGMKNSIIISMTTTSSAISLPVQIEECEENFGVSSRISRLVNSLAMSLNSDGLALTISISCMMIAQFYGIELTLSQQLLMVFVATVSTLGNLLVPGGALVAIAVALNMMGLPVDGVAIVAGVDWFAGIFRTLLNVVDDVLCTLLIAIHEKEIDLEIFRKKKI